MVQKGVVKLWYVITDEKVADVLTNPLYRVKFEYFHDKLKHIEIRYFYIRNMVQKVAIKLQYVSTDEKVVDVFTNPLSRLKFEYLCKNLGVLRKYLPCKEKQ